MAFQTFAGAAFRALTVAKDGPSLYDVCDPLFSRHAGGDPHFAKFYKTALGNPPLRGLLCRTGLFEFRDEAALARLRSALPRARADESPVRPPIAHPVHVCRAPATPPPPPPNTSPH